MAKIKYRIETRYSQKIARCIFKKLSENEQKKSEEKSEKEEQESLMNNILLDTSSLNVASTIDIIEKAEKVYLTIETIEEIERLKKKSNLMGYNARKVLSESAKDMEGKKYIVVEGKGEDDYVDNNIITYCRENKELTLVTLDNGMANKAKAYGIRYIIPHDERIENEPKNYIKTLRNTDMLGSSLILNIPDTNRINYVLMRKNKRVLPEVGLNFIH